MKQRLGKSLCSILEPQRLSSPVSGGYNKNPRVQSPVSPSFARGRFGSKEKPELSGAVPCHKFLQAVVPFKIYMNTLQIHMYACQFIHLLYCEYMYVKLVQNDEKMIYIYIVLCARGDFCYIRNWSRTFSFRTSGLSEPLNWLPSQRGSDNSYSSVCLLVLFLQALPLKFPAVYRKNT